MSKNIPQVGPLQWGWINAASGISPGTKIFFQKRLSQHPKASIRRHIANPLPADETDCKRFFVNAVNDNPDDDASIFYGTNQQRQDAAVYVRKQPPSGGGRRGEATSIIDTSFVDSGGKVQQVHVSVASHQTDKGFVLEIDQTPNVVIAMSSLSAALSSEQFQTLSRGFKERLHSQASRNIPSVML